MDIYRASPRRNRGSARGPIAAAALVVGVLAVSADLLVQGWPTQSDSPAANPLAAQRSWEVVNVGNGYYQIRLQPAGDGKKQCLTSVPKLAEVMLADCELQKVAPSTVRDWRFDRLVAGGYQVVNRWADFYGYPACLAGNVANPALESCGRDDGRERSLQGIAKLYADPTEP